MKRVQFRVSYPEAYRHPIQRGLAEAAATRCELLVWSPTSEPTTLLWVDGDHTAAETVVAGVSSTVERTVVADTSGTYVFLRQTDYEFPVEVMELVGGARAVFLPPVVLLADDGVRFEAVGDGGAVSTLHDELAELGSVSIERVHPFERRQSPAALTDRQRAALDAAVEVGYYEVPREGSVADVAAALDCAHSTAGELLRKAEAAVVREHTIVE